MIRTHRELLRGTILGLWSKEKRKSPCSGRGLARLGGIGTCISFCMRMRYTERLKTFQDSSPVAAFSRLRWPICFVSQTDISSTSLSRPKIRKNHPWSLRFPLQCLTLRQGCRQRQKLQSPKAKPGPGPGPGRGAKSLGTGRGQSR